MIKNFVKNKYICKSCRRKPGGQRPTKWARLGYFNILGLILIKIKMLILFYLHKSFLNHKSCQFSQSLYTVNLFQVSRDKSVLIALTSCFFLLEESTWSRVNRDSYLLNSVRKHFILSVIEHLLVTYIRRITTWLLVGA